VSPDRKKCGVRRGTTPLTVETSRAQGVVTANGWNDRFKANIPKTVVAFVRQRLLAHAGIHFSRAQRRRIFLTLYGHITKKKPLSVQLNGSKCVRKLKLARNRSFRLRLACREVEQSNALLRRPSDHGTATPKTRAANDRLARLAIELRALQ
jgi:hypothetical protein